MNTIIGLLLCCTLHVNAQKVADKELIGIWLMESMQFEGEKKVECGAKSNYTQVKFYGPDGEYACAEIARGQDGTIRVLPHEYGTYTFRNGKYTEMGREGNMTLVDATTFKGRWKNRHDVWKKETHMSPQLKKYIIDCCKTRNTPKDLQQQMQELMFKR